MAPCASFIGTPGTPVTHQGMDPYTAALTVEADFEQSDYTYDAAGNVVEEISRERFHDASGVGALGDPTTNPKARVLYSMSYPDPLGRIVATANYGTNGGTAPGRPDTAPERSDSVLVSTTDYNARGETAATTDPNGIVTVQQFDDAGRLIKTIENFEP
jgi:YD repeat-containing protein